MGKKLIIKGANFSANALEPSGVVWSQTTLVKPFLVSNPSNADFGQIDSGGTTTTTYKKLARLATTIEVPNGKTLRMKIDNIIDQPKAFWATQLSYQTAWSGSTIPSSALPAVGIDFPAESYITLLSYLNNSGGTQYFQATIAIENVTEMTETNYKVYYYVE